MTRWNSLPQEIRGMILGYVVIHDRIAPYAPVSIEWHDAIEKTFRHLRIQASSSDACGRTPTVFESLSRLCGRHRRLVKHIWLNIEHTKHPKWWDGSYNLSSEDRAISVTVKRLDFDMPSAPSVQAVTKFLLPRHCRRQFSAETLSCMSRRLPRLEEISLETWDLSDIHYGFSHGYRYAQHLLAAPGSFRNVKSMTVFQDRNEYFNAVSRLHREELPRSHQATVMTPPVIPSSGLLQTAAQIATRMPKLERLRIWNGGVNEECAFTYRKHQHNASVTWQAKGGIQLHPEVYSAWGNVHSRYFLNVENKGTWPIIMSHAAAISCLGLEHVVSDVSLRQMQLENSIPY
ncbi:hypothetical protein NOF04DRAFT_1272743 [Fusarium oxysporum II5]|nr:hypothetical protein NOF04DRAFT_1272743 [Fusarium oxysporum II5]